MSKSFIIILALIVVASVVGFFIVARAVAPITCPQKNLDSCENSLICKIRYVEDKLDVGGLGWREPHKECISLFDK